MWLEIWCSATLSLNLISYGTIKLIATRISDLLQLGSITFFFSLLAVLTLTSPPHPQAHLHHYCRVEGMEEGLFEESLSSLSSLVSEYESLQATVGQSHTSVPRLGIC